MRCVRFSWSPQLLPFLNQRNTGTEARKNVIGAVHSSFALLVQLVWPVSYKILGPIMFDLVFIVEPARYGQKFDSRVPTRHSFWLKSRETPQDKVQIRVTCYPCLVNQEPQERVMTSFHIGLSQSGIVPLSAFSRTLIGIGEIFPFALPRRER